MLTQHIRLVPTFLRCDSKIMKSDGTWQHNGGISTLVTRLITFCFISGRSLKVCQINIDISTNAIKFGSMLKLLLLALLMAYYYYHRFYKHCCKINGTAISNESIRGRYVETHFIN